MREKPSGMADLPALHLHPRGVVTAEQGITPQGSSLSAEREERQDTCYTNPVLLSVDHSTARSVRASDA